MQRRRLLLIAVLTLAAGAVIGLTVGIVLLSAGDDEEDTALLGTPQPNATVAQTPLTATTRPATATAMPSATPPPSATPAAPREPPHAPDGRTGIARLDAIIENLLTADAATLADLYARAEVRRGFDGNAIPAEEWIRRLAGAERSLYAVTERPVNEDIFLAVFTPDGLIEGWLVTTQVGMIQRIEIRGTEHWIPEAEVTVASVVSAPDITYSYHDYLVLPPREDLPEPPPVHPLSTRTGDEDVDGLIELVEAADGDGLANAVSDRDSLLVRSCFGSDSRQDSRYVETWARDLTEDVTGIHSVSAVPGGYHPQAEHQLLFVRQLHPYRWEAVGVLETDGRIVALIDDVEGQQGQPCNIGSIGPEGDYLRSMAEIGSRNYLIAPPEDGLAGLDASRNSLRTGVPIVDAVLDAMQAGDEAALAGLIEYTPTQCGVHDYAPPCPDGEPQGTLVDMLPYSVCHGGGALPEDAPRTVADMLSSEAGEQAIYAVVAVPPPEDQQPPRPPQAGPQANYHLVLASTTVGISERGVSHLRGSCGDHHPEWRITGGQPDYLLPPPQ